MTISLLSVSTDSIVSTVSSSTVFIHLPAHPWISQWPPAESWIVTMVCNVHVFPVLVLDIGSQDQWIFLCLMSTFIEQPGMDLYWKLLASVKMPAHGLLAGFRIMARSGFGTVYQHAPTIFAQHVCLIAYSINYISYYWQWFLWNGQARIYIVLGFSAPASCRESFHCILAAKLCPTALSPLPSVPLKVTLPKTLKHNIYLASQLVAVWMRKWITKVVEGKKRRHSVGSDSFLFFKNMHLFLEGAWKTHLRGLDVLQRGRRTWEQQDKQRLQCLRDGESVKGEERIQFFPCDQSENEHVGEGRVWKGAPHSQAALLCLPSDWFPEERQPLLWRKEEDVLFFPAMSTGHHQRENQR